MQESPQRSDRFELLFSSAESSSPGVGYPSCSRDLSRISPNRNDPNGYYRFLGISPSATYEQIKSAVRAKYRQYHPDGWGANTDLFHRTKWIAKILLNSRVKAFYDATPEGYQFSDDETRDGQILDEIPLEVDVDYAYDYYAFEPEFFDSPLAQEWYDCLVSVAPIFRYNRVVRVVLTNDKRPFWIGGAGMFTIPRWWEPSIANAFALFSVLLREY